MASGIATTPSNAILNFLFRDGAYTPQATYYVALFTAAPGYSGGGTEASFTGYARQPVDNDSAAWTSPTAREISNVNSITFPQAGTSGGTITHVGLMSAISGGTLFAFGSLTTPISYPVGATRVFPAGALVIRLD